MPDLQTYNAIASTTVSGSSTTSVTFGSGNTLTQAFTDLVLVCSVQVTTTTDNMVIEFNGDTTSGLYSWDQMISTGSAQTVNRYNAQNAGAIADYFPTSTTFGIAFVNISNYSNSNVFKSYLSRGGDANAGATTFMSGIWRNLNAITQIRVREGSSLTLKAGSMFTLYGIKAN